MEKKAPVIKIGYNAEIKKNNLHNIYKHKVPNNDIFYLNIHQTSNITIIIFSVVGVHIYVTSSNSQPS